MSAAGVRTRALLALGLAVTAAVLALVLRTEPVPAADGSAQTYRVDVIFDTAKGILPAQLLKIAGARAGIVDDVTLTKDFKARIELKIDTRFAPFKADAQCSIQPEGLISERFVQCDPGSIDARPLGKVDGIPTVPVQRTTVPIALTDLFNIFTMPVRQRFSVVVSSLGLGLAGRGEDLNAVLRRANPTLGLLRQVLKRLGDDKADLKRAVSSTDAVIAELARRPEATGRFVDEAATALGHTARKREQLRASVRTLPAVLDEVKPALANFNSFSRRTRPLLRQLRSAAPQATALLNQVKPFAATGRPALKALGDASLTGTKVAGQAKPVVKLLRSFAAAAGPTGTSLSDLLVNARDRGVAESLMTFLYNAAGFTARYDTTSHIAPALILMNSCSMFATTQTADCRATYTPQAAARTQARTPAKSSTPAPAKPARPAPVTPLAPITPGQGGQGPILKLPGLPPIQLPKLPGLPPAGNADKNNDGAPDPVEKLFGYLLG